MRALNRVFRAKTINTQRRGVAFSIRQLFANSEPGVWYDPSDLSTLFQNAEGTTPVTAVEQPVGLMLDKSKGLVLGPELVTNGTFDTDIDGWTAGGGASVSWDSGGGGRIAVTNSSSGGRGQTVTFFPTVIGQWYVLKAFYNSGNTGSNAYAVLGSSPSSSNTAVVANWIGSTTRYFIATHTTTFLTLTNNSGNANSTGYFDNISVRELPGNHAYQTTATSRPVLSARYNLLTKTEQFDDAVWGKVNSSITSTSIQDPLGTNRAQQLTINSISNPELQSPTFSAVASVVYTSSIYVKYVNSPYIRVVTPVGSVWYTITSNSAVVGTNQVNSAQAIAVGDGWFRLVATFTAASTASAQIKYTLSLSDGSATEVIGSVYIWGADVRVVNDGVNLQPYQRVNTVTDYDTTGFPHYLRFDGVDDWLVTPTITPGTDKAQVFAGVRKLSDALPVVVVETGNTYWTVNGFSVQAATTSTDAGASSPFANYYAVVGDGNGSTTVDFDVFNTQNVYPSPSTNTISAVFDRGAAPLSKTNLRVNGVVPTKVTGSFTGTAVTGNVLNTPLYIGRRAGTTFPFNGHLYSLIVRFGSNLPIATIENTEKYINGLTKAY